jgi:hypothetical protein
MSIPGTTAFQKHMNNDQLILDQIVDEQRQARAPDAKMPEFFETYVAEQVLKNFDLSDDEIESGLVGNTLDGGIDGIYTFANGELVLDDFDHSGLKKNVLIELVIFQSKTSNGFDEETINKFSAVSGHLFSLANQVDNYKDRYNFSVVFIRRLHRDSHRFAFITSMLREVTARKCIQTCGQKLATLALL